MNKRLIISIGLGLSMVLAVSLALVSASGERVGRLPLVPHSAKPVSPVKNRKQTGGVAVQTPTLLAGQSATLLPDGRWLLTGGESKEGPLSSALIVDTRANTTTPLPNGLIHPRIGHSATALPDGTILILGGLGADGQMAVEAEIFNTESQKFHIIPLMGLTPRAYHTATLLTDGRVLIVGGIKTRGRMTSAAEILDAQMGTASALPSTLTTPRRGHTATLLSNGSVLVSGGADKDVAITSGEVFAPETERFSPVDSLSEQDEVAAPYLAASLPKDSEASVPKEIRIALRFSKPLSVESINSQTVILAGPEGVLEARVVPAEQGRLAFITPKAPLLSHTTYTVSLSGATDVTDQLLAPASFTFTTAGTDEHNHDQEPAPEQAQPADGQPSEKVWTPDANNLKGDWRSGDTDAARALLPALKAEPGVTALSGQVLTLSGRPLANVTLRIGDLQAVTDQTGRFLLTSLTAGQPSLLIRGDTASRPGTTFGTFEAKVDIAADKTNVLPYTIWLPVLDDQHEVRLPAPTPREVVVTTPLVPGMEVRIPSNTVLRMPPGHGMMMKGNASHLMGSLAITPIPLDRTPFPLPPGIKEGLLYTLQLHGAKVEGLNGEKRPGIRIIYPNLLGLPAGTRVDFYNYEAGGAGWYLYGQGTVTPDGRQVMPDPGVELNSMYCFALMGGASAPADGPNGSAVAGDPVDLATGLFVYEKTDLILPDVIPISLTRTYRQNDGAIRAFGKGATHPYNMYIIGDTVNYGEVILPDGARIRLNKIADNLYEHTGTPSSFYKATLRAVDAPLPDYNGGWDLKLLNGTIYHFYRRSWGDSLGVHASVTGLHSIEDRYGNKLIIERDYNLRPIKITSPHGRRVEFTYDGDSERIIQAKDNIGRVVTYEYYSSWDLKKVTDANQNVTEYTYDTASRMLTIKDARGIVFLTNEYDANGRVKKQTQADATTFEFAYGLDSNNKITQTDVTDPRGNVRRTTFNQNGYALTEIYPVGKPEQQTYAYVREAVTNLPLSATDALGRTISFSYDSRGNVISVTRLTGTPEAVTTSYTYESAFNQMATVTDPLNHTTTYAYDNHGNLTSITDSLNHQTTYAYSATGQIISATDGLGNTTQYIYDSGDLVEVKDPLGRSIKRYVDGGGRSTRITDQAGHTGKIEYDSLNRPVQVTDPLGGVTTIVYDENGNVQSLTDARGGITSYTYDQMDRLTKRKDGLLVEDLFDYDPAGNPIKITDRRGKVTKYSYDNLNRLSFTGYGATGEGENQTYESTITPTYDAANRLTQVADSVSGNITFGYDNLSRLTSEATPQGTVGYTYDAAGRQTSMTVPGQAVVNYIYDNADRLTGITQGAISVGFGYDNADRRTSLSLPNSAMVEASFDEASQLTGLTYKLGATTLGDLTYEYDSLGRRAKMGGSFARVTMPQSLGSATYNAANRMTQRSASTLSYDGSGNLLSDGTNTYTWDARDQLSSISGPGLAASFQYDAFGRRVSKTVNAQTTGYLYDGVNVVQEQAGGTPLANFLTGGVDEVFMRTDSAGARSYLTDALGSTLALLDAGGAAQTSYTYDPFGGTTASGAGSSNTSQYAGRENDQTGLYYNRARYYSPQLQRFISEDPAGFSGGVNLYAYTSNNPISFRDPSGQWPTPDTLVDAGFIAYDVYSLVTGGRKNLGTNLVALGLDVVCLAVPVATGGGAAYRSGTVLMFAGSKAASKAAVHAETAVMHGGGGRKMPNEELLAPPSTRGNAPIGKDGHPVELHHRGQKPNSPLDEMTRTDHRGKGNYSKNHDNTGQHPSEINRSLWKKERSNYWKGEWDNGRFADFFD